MGEVEYPKSASAGVIKKGEDLQDPLVFSEIFGLYGGKLFRYALLHVGAKEDAEDVLSCAFVRLWEYGQHYPDAIIHSLSAFLYRTVRNIIIDQYRKRRPATSLDVLFAEGVELPDRTPVAPEIRTEAILLLEKCAALAIKDRDLLILRFVEDLSIREIAGVYEISETNTAVRIHRAIKRLRKKLR